MNNFQQFKWKADEEERLLTFIKRRVNFSTVDVRWAIEHSQCFVNGKLERFGSRRVKAPDVVEFRIRERSNLRFEKERVLFEDDEILVYNKPAALPSTGEFSLEKMIHLKVAHRLDRDTTGVILLAKNERALKTLEDLFRSRKIKKSYLAYVHGLFHPKRSVEGYLSKHFEREGECVMKMEPKGLYSKTDFELVSQRGKYSLIRCYPLTGRTHQIRIHLQSIGHPILGDPLYGTKKDRQFSRPLLHSESILCQLPWRKEELKVKAPLSKDFCFSMEI